MLGLLGLLSAMLAGIMGDSVMNAKEGDSADNMDDVLPTQNEAVSPETTGDFLADPTSEPEIEALVPHDELVPIEELPGEGPPETLDPADQLLIGSNDADLLEGGVGNDGIMGSGGADTLFGGAGNDALVGADDDDADLLYGGDGHDSLTLGPGDTATGGEGEDLFTLASFGPNTPPSMITDYSADSDHIVLMYDPEVHPEPVVSTEMIDGTEDMSVLLDGVQVAIIQGALGLTGADIQLLSA